MSEIAERGVTFILKAQIDQNAKSAIDSFAKQIASAQTQIDTVVASSASSAAQGVADNVDKIGAAVAQALQKESSMVIQELTKQNQAQLAATTARKTQLEKSLQEQAQMQSELGKLSLEQLYAERDRINAERLGKEESAFLVSQQKKLEAEKALAKAFHEVNDEMVKTGEMATIEQMQQVAQLADAFEKASKEHQKTEERWTKVQEGEHKKQVDDAIRTSKEKSKATEDAAKAAQEHNAKIEKSYRDVLDSSSKAVESVLRFSKGVAMIGLVGEDNIQKVQDSLLLMQGAFDSTKGAIDTVKAIDDAYTAWRSTIELTTKSLSGLASASTIANNAKNLAGGGAGATVAGVGAGAAGGSLIGRGIGMASAGGSTLINFAGGGSAGPAMEGTGLAAGAGPLAIFAAAVVAAASAAFALKSAFETAKDSFKFGFGKGGQAGGFTETVGTSSYNPFAGVFAQESLGESLFALGRYSPAGIAAGMVGADTETSTEKSRDAQDKRLKAAEEQLKNNRLMNERDQQIVEEGTQRVTAMKEQQQSIEDRIFDQKLKSLSVEERRGEIEKKIGESMENASNKVAGASERVIHFQQQRLANEQAIHDKAMQTNEKNLHAAERTLQLAEQKLETAKKEASSAETSFGLKTEDQQAKILEARKQLGQDAKQLDLEQLQSLRGITKETDALVEAEAKRRANAAGFGAVFGQENEKQIKAMETEIEQVLKVEVKNLENIRVQLEGDWQKVADDVAAQVKIQWEEAISGISDKIKEQTEIIVKAERMLEARNGPVR